MLYQSIKIKVKIFGFSFELFSMFFLQVNYIQQPASPLPIAMVQLTDRSPYPQQSYQVYRRFPTPIQQPQQFNNIPSYSNGAVVQVYDQTNFNNQQQQPAAVIQTPNQQQISLQLRRERQRRAIIDKIVVLFDENGLFIHSFSFLN